MQTLTIPASISKRKQACNTCRQRKKKCDAQRPACGLCQRWGVQCTYKVPADDFTIAPSDSSDADRAWQSPWPLPRADRPVAEVELPQPLDFVRMPGLSFNTAVPDLQTAYPTPDSIPQLDGSATDQDVLAEFHLPSDDLLVELVSLFFDNLYHVFPCFHRRTFESQLQDGTMQKESSLVLYAMCCVAARLHPDPAVKQRQKDWYEQAKFSYQLTQRNPCPGMRTIQAALLLVVYANTTGDFSSSYMFLDKAWRLAVTLGMNRLDAGSHDTVRSMPQERYGFDELIKNFKKREDTTAIEKEELRQTLWLLFVIDRNQAWPTGWPNAVSETHFRVNLPLSHWRFQAMKSDSQVTQAGNTPLPRKLDRLITSTTVAGDPVNILQYLCVAHTILGRVAEVVHSLHDPLDAGEYAEDCAALDAHIVKFRLSLPRQATSVIEALPEDRGHVVWLQVILNNSAMLLHYCSAKDVPDNHDSSHFPLAVAAARNTAKVVKDASRISIDLLLSPHLAPSLYVAACVLIIQWRLTDTTSLKDEVDLFRLVFDRMNEAFVFLGLKYKIALEHDLERSKEKLGGPQRPRLSGFLG